MLIIVIFTGIIIVFVRVPLVFDPPHVFEDGLPSPYLTVFCKLRMATSKIWNAMMEWNRAGVGLE